MSTIRTPKKNCSSDKKLCTNCAKQPLPLLQRTILKRRQENMLRQRKSRRGSNQYVRELSSEEKERKMDGEQIEKEEDEEDEEESDAEDNITVNLSSTKQMEHCDVLERERKV